MFDLVPLIVRRIGTTLSLAWNQAYPQRCFDAPRLVNLDAFASSAFFVQERRRLIATKTTAAVAAAPIVESASPSSLLVSPSMMGGGNNNGQPAPAPGRK